MIKRIGRGGLTDVLVCDWVRLLGQGASLTGWLSQPGERVGRTGGSPAKLTEKAPGVGRTLLANPDIAALRRLR